MRDRSAPNRLAVALAALAALGGVAVGCVGVAGATGTRAASAVAAPRIVGTSPTSPADSLTPVVVGRAAARTRVSLFAGAGCAGRALGAGTADARGRFAV